MSDDAPQPQPVEIKLEIDQSVAQLALMAINVMDKLPTTQLQKLNDRFEGKIAMRSDAKSVIKALEMIGWSYLWAMKEAKAKHAATKSGREAQQTSASDLTSRD